MKFVKTLVGFEETDRTVYLNSAHIVQVKEDKDENLAVYMSNGDVHEVSGFLLDQNQALLSVIGHPDAET